MKIWLASLATVAYAEGVGIFEGITQGCARVSRSNEVTMDRRSVLRVLLVALLSLSVPVLAQTT